MTRRVYHWTGKVQLRDYHTVEIEDVTTPSGEEIKEVYVTSELHVGREWKLSWSYSKDYTDEEILRDGNIGRIFTEKFGPDWWIGSIRV